MSAPVHLEEIREYRTTIRLDASTIERHDAGWIYVWGVATTVGVLDYPEHGTHELRDADQVFDPVSMATLRGVPLTLDHPSIEVNRGLVTPATVRELTHGWVLEVVRAGNDLRVRVCIASEDALASVAAGIIELSCGYRSKYKGQPGVFESPDGPVPYTGRQFDIRYNHLALVPLARAGHRARLTLDSAPRRRRGNMQPLKIRNLLRSIPSFMADAIAQQAAAHKTAIDNGQVRHDAIEVESVTIGGTELILPKAMVESLMAALGIGGAAPAAGAPAPEMDSGAPPMTPDEELPRMDGRRPAAPAATPPAAAKADDIDARIATAVAAAVKAEVARAVPQVVDVRLDAIRTSERNRERVERLAAPLLADGFDTTGHDEYAIAAIAVTRLDSAQRDDVERLAAAARGGDLKAAGRLEERLEAAARTHHDAQSTGGALGLAIDTARVESVRVDSSSKPEVDAIEASRERMNQRLRGVKPAATA